MRKYSGPKDRVDAARSFDTAPSDLRELAKSTLIFIREAVAENPRTEPDVLDSLVPLSLETEEDFTVTAALVRNPSCSPERFVIIGERVRAAMHEIPPRNYTKNLLIDALFTCQHVPFKILAEIIHPTVAPKHIRSKTAGICHREDVLHVLLGDPSEKVKRRAERTLQAIVHEREKQTSKAQMDNSID